MATHIERRKGERFACLIEAEIISNGRRMAGAKITDFSTNGARIEVALSVSVPARFTLRLKDDRQTEVEFLWRIDDQVGVLFLEPMKEVLPETQWTNFIPIPTRVAAE
jgi:hypothetical protein